MQDNYELYKGDLIKIRINLMASPGENFPYIGRLAHVDENSIILSPYERMGIITDEEALERIRAEEEDHGNMLNKSSKLITKLSIATIERMDFSEVWED